MVENMPGVSEEIGRQKLASLLVEEQLSVDEQGEIFPMQQATFVFVRCDLLGIYLVVHTIR